MKFAKKEIPFEFFGGLLVWGVYVLGLMSLVSLVLWGCGIGRQSMVRLHETALMVSCIAASNYLQFQSRGESKWTKRARHALAFSVLIAATHLVVSLGYRMKIGNV